MALIGEQFDDADEICGVVASVRPRQDKLSLWTKNAANEAAQVLTICLYSSVSLCCSGFVFRFLWCYGICYIKQFIYDIKDFLTVIEKEDDN